MRIIKVEIKNYILSYLRNEAKKKKIKINFNLKKVDFFDKELIDSLSFLDLISFLEKKLDVEIDLSDVNPNNLTKVDKLTNIIHNNID
jgi:acyl carrier protein|tara:strand:+ start:6295 stop:6558 length:264 start_codon:yes stop_codon:yes gene_type:complete